jgi:thiamine pyrophosphate-dependent acetolactate synthase large subunit-like protein
MGGAAMLGLGLARARPSRRVVVITGDGEMLMGLGSLATIAVDAPANLVIVVLDNEHYGQTGMQPAHTGRGVDLAGIARAAGFVDATEVRTEGTSRRWRAGCSPCAGRCSRRSRSPPRPRRWCCRRAMDRT